MQKREQGSTQFIDSNDGQEPDDSHDRPQLVGPRSRVTLPIEGVLSAPHIVTLSGSTASELWTPLVGLRVPVQQAPDRDGSHGHKTPAASQEEVCLYSESDIMSVMDSGNTSALKCFW